MFEWFKRLDYGADGRRKDMSLGLAIRGLEHFVNPAVKECLV